MSGQETPDNPVARELDAALPGAMIESKSALGELTLSIEPGRIMEVCVHLKTAQKFQRLSSVTAVKCRVPGDSPEIDSVTSVWRGANWYEREVFDLFGILFRGHPNLKRIMLPEDWEGHPLRKDLPVHGFKYSYQSE